VKGQYLTPHLLDIRIGLSMDHQTQIVKPELDTPPRVGSWEWVAEGRRISFLKNMAWDMSPKRQVTEGGLLVANVGVRLRGVVFRFRE